MFKNDFFLNSVEVKGEISNLTYHAKSGHVYFTLKDRTAAIKCAMFKQYAMGLTFKLEEGMSVIAKGPVEVYERDGTYQIYVRSVRKEGIGDLFKEFERLKEKLSEEGMFDASYKRPIPKHVKTLGVVTAPTGAAVRDIINVSKRRDPGIQIILYPAIVQGDQAPRSIINGINALNAYGVDVIIAGRGGGSIEDLWGFNDEGVARTIFNSEAPVISAVGHETDFTIADFVSDLRAPTPSAAAELAVCDAIELKRKISEKAYLLNRDISHILNTYRSDMARLSDKLSLLSPTARIETKKQMISKYKERLNLLMDSDMKDRHHRLVLLSEKLNVLSPLTRLSSGYSYVAVDSGKALKSIGQVNRGDALKIYVTDGCITARVEGSEGKLGSKLPNLIEDSNTSA